jgi:branched-chain amino acid transport system substrate-binding protein
MSHKTVNRSLRFAPFFVLTIFSLILAACGSSSNGATDIKDITIASELPISGTYLTLGLPTQQGAQLAIEQAKLDNGYTLKWVGSDDFSTTTGAADAKLGQTNIQKYIGDQKVLGVAGPLNSGVAYAEMQLANKAGLVLISPSATNPGLTLSKYADENGFNFALAHPAGKKNAFFRIPGTDIIQGKLLASLAKNKGYKKVFIVDDKTPYGAGLAKQFKDNFVGSGGEVVGTQASIEATQTSKFKDLAAQIAATSPDFVFYGGVVAGRGGLLKKDVADAAAGKSIPFVGGDGIAQDDGWQKDAGTAATGDWATTPAAELGSLSTSSSTASKFVADYKARFNADPIAYSAMAYDAAGSIIQAIKDLIKDGKPVNRANVLEAVQKVTYAGVTGTIKFDENGDNAGSKYYSLWEVKEDGKWTFVKNIDAATI